MDLFYEFLADLVSTGFIGFCSTILLRFLVGCSLPKDSLSLVPTLKLLSISLGKIFSGFLEFVFNLIS